MLISVDSEKLTQHKSIILDEIKYAESLEQTLKDNLVFAQDSAEEFEIRKLIDTTEQLVKKLKSRQEFVDAVIKITDVSHTRLRDTLSDALYEIKKINKK